jgi:hypothetical protein
MFPDRILGVRESGLPRWQASRARLGRPAAFLIRQACDRFAGYSSKLGDVGCGGVLPSLGQGLQRGNCGLCHPAPWRRAKVGELASLSRHAEFTASTAQIETKQIARCRDICITCQRPPLFSVILCQIILGNFDMLFPGRTFQRQHLLNFRRRAAEGATNPDGVHHQIRQSQQNHEMENAGNDREREANILAPMHRKEL